MKNYYYDNEDDEPGSIACKRSRYGKLLRLLRGWLLLLRGSKGEVEVFSSVCLLRGQGRGRMSTKPSQPAGSQLVTSVHHVHHP